MLPGHLALPLRALIECPAVERTFGPLNIIANPGAPKADFELWSLAVSAINGCGMCLDSHEAELRKHQVPNTSIQAALRIASVVHAVSRVIAAENAVKQAA